MRDFTIKTMPDRIPSRTHLFTGILEKGIDIGKAIEHLSE